MPETLSIQDRIALLVSTKAAPFASNETRASYIGFFGEPPTASSIAALLEVLEADQLITRRPRSGWKLTAAGQATIRAAFDELLDDRTFGVVDDAYHAFLPLNHRFKTVCTHWQLRLQETGYVPNDHSDASWDAGVRSEFSALHDEVMALIEELEAVAPQYRFYRQAFERAIERFSQGELDALLAPMTGSYHDHVMEFHSDLMTLLGRERTEADGD